MKIAAVAIPVFYLWITCPNPNSTCCGTNSSAYDSVFKSCYDFLNVIDASPTLAFFCFTNYPKSQDYSYMAFIMHLQPWKRKMLQIKLMASPCVLTIGCSKVLLSSYIDIFIAILLHQNSLIEILKISLQKMDPAVSMRPCKIIIF